MPKRKPLSALNRIYVYLECLLAQQGQNANSCDWIELTRTPDLERLRQAAAYVAHRHPAIQAATEFGGRKAYTWVRNPKAYPEIHFERRHTPCPVQPDDSLLHNIWGVPLDHQNGPPWRLHVTEFNDKCLLQSITSHIYTCGKSANLITADLLNAYATLHCGGELDDLVIDVTDRNANALFAPDWSLARRIQSSMMSVISMSAEFLTRPIGLATNCKSVVSRGKTRVAFVEYGPEMWTHLRRFAKDEGISRHPFYLAAWAEAILEFNTARGSTQRGAVKFMDNFCLRSFSPQDLGRFYDLCAPPYAILVPYERSSKAQRKHLYDVLEDLKAGKILDELARFNMYHVIIRLLGKIRASKLVISAVAKSPFILSNTGPIPMEILAPHPLNVERYFSFPQLFPPGKIMLILTSTRVDLRAVFLWDQDAIDEDAMTQDLIPRFGKALERSIAFDAPLEPAATAAE